MRPLVYCLLIVMTASCTQQAYYQSPMHGSMTPYKTMPLSSDSSKSAIYADAAVIAGAANDDFKDDIVGGYVGLHRAHAYKDFQFFYGANIAFGQYQVSAFYPQSENIFYYRNGSLNDSLINSINGPKGFGTAGLSGGFNGVTRFNGGEWRYLGFELNWQQEWGSYYAFRNKLFPRDANVNDISNTYVTASVTTDIIFKTRNGASGFKAAVGIPTRKYTYYNTAAIESRVLPYHTSFTFHYTGNRFTGYGQWNMGYHMMMFQFGMNCRLIR